MFDSRRAASLFHFPLFSPHNIQIHLLFSYCTHNGFVVYTVLMLVLALDSGILVLEQCWSPHLQNTNPKKRKKENGDVNCYTIASVEMSVLFTCSAVQSLIILVKTQGSKFMTFISVSRYIASYLYMGHSLTALYKLLYNILHPFTCSDSTFLHTQ